MAGSTGLEPAASAVTGQRSNQLNYDPAFADGVKTKTPVMHRTDVTLPIFHLKLKAFGGQCGTRTCDPLLVRQVL